MENLKASCQQPAARSRHIIHVDMDAYFASIEQRDMPLYRKKPLVVCHTDDPVSQRGVVSTASYEARAYGIESSMSVLEAKVRCPDAVYLAGNYDKYLHNTKMILDVCKKYSDLVEVFSVDELFMDVTSTSSLFGGSVAIAKEIQNSMKRELDLSCSIGVGPNKLIAKMASEFRKPSGFTVISSEELPDVIAPLPIRKMVGVGRRMARHLDSIGVRTIGELAEVPVDYLEKKFGVVGIALHRASLGLDNSPVLPEHQGEMIKSFGHTSALGKGTTDLKELERILLGLCEGVTRRMRKEGYGGRTIVLRLCLARMIGYTRSCSLGEFTFSTSRIFKVAKKLLRKEKRAVSRYPATLIGVSVTNLTSKEKGYQLSIFDFLDNRELALTKAVDSLKDKYGERVIVRGSLLNWKRRYHSIPKLEIK